MTTLIYPIASSWILGDGWLKSINFHDGAGAGYIHLLGGVSGLVGTSLLGPRTGIFDKTTVSNLVKAASMKKHRGYYIDEYGKMRNKIQHRSINNSENSHASNFHSMSSSNNFQSTSKVAQSRNFRSFYNLDEEVPMKYRIFLFRQ
jgi:hypothetical protein